MKAKRNSLLLSALWNSSWVTWSTLVTLFYTPFLVGHLGKDFYGVLVLVMSVIGITGIMEIGTHEAVQHFVAFYYAREDYEGVQRVIGAGWVIGLCAGIAGALIVFFGAPWIIRLMSFTMAERQVAESLFRIAALVFMVKIGTGVLRSVPPALERYDIVSIALIAENSVQVAGVVALILLGHGIIGLVTWMAVTSLIVFPFYLLLAVQLLPEIKIYPHLSRRGLREIFGYGVFSFIANVLGVVSMQADRLLLGALAGTSFVAYLAVPFQIAFRLVSGVSSLGAALFPRFSSMQDLRQTRKLFLSSTWAMLTMSIVLFVPLTILFPSFLRLWINEEFAQSAARVGQIIALSCIVRGGFVTYVALFQGMGKPQLLATLSVCTSVTSLLLNVILIPKFGLMGAGYCYLGTTIWGFFAIGFAWKRLLAGESLYPLFRVIALPIGGGLAVLLAMHRLGLPALAAGWLSLVLLGTMGAAVTLVAVTILEWVSGGRQLSYTGEAIRAMRRQTRALFSRRRGPFELDCVSGTSDSGGMTDDGDSKLRVRLLR